MRVCCTVLRACLAGLLLSCPTRAQDRPRRGDSAWAFFALFKTHHGSRYPLDVCFALLACGQTKSRHGKGWGLSKRESSSSQRFRLSIPACTCGVVGRMGISRARAPIQQASKAERSNNRSWIEPASRYAAIRQTVVMYNGTSTKTAVLCTVPRQHLRL